MSANQSDLMEALTRAARTDDARAFDDALDRVLERARDAADPESNLQALVAGRLRETLSADTAGAIGAAGALGAASGRVGRVAAAASRRLRFARGLGLLGAGVAIGFIWGRSPAWWPSPHVAPPDVTMVSAPIATTGSSAPARDAIASPPARAEGSHAALGSSHASENQAAAMSPPQPAASVDDAAPPARPRAGPRPTARAPLRSDPDSLRFALQQLQKAQLFLRASEPKRALEALDVLDARVAASILRDEREVTRTLALCDAGDGAKASALARHFLERAPDSAYVASLRESCAGPAALLDEMRERTSNSPR